MGKVAPELEKALDALSSYFFYSTHNGHPVAAYESARVEDGREAASQAYAQRVARMHELLMKLPEFVEQAMKRDAYVDPAPCTWEELRPYVRTAQEMQRREYSGKAAKLIFNAAIWWPEKFGKKRILGVSGEA
jgi:hypothetical protein